MDRSTIYHRPFEVHAKLGVFGCTVEVLQDVALAAVAARNEATALHPMNAPGMYSYMEGVAALRAAFLPIDGWEIYRRKNVEGVQNKKLGLVVLFQNVDRACGSHDPIPVSQKGEAVTDLVDNPTGYLFDFMEKEAKAAENTQVWFFCVSCRGEEVQAELSRPREIRDGNFGTLAERIFILTDSDWTPGTGGKQDLGEDDLDVHVSKKS